MRLFSKIVELVLRSAFFLYDIPFFMWGFVKGIGLNFLSPRERMKVLDRDIQKLNRELDSLRQKCQISN